MAVALVAKPKEQKSGLTTSSQTAPGSRSTGIQSGASAGLPAFNIVSEQQNLTTAGARPAEGRPDEARTQQDLPGGATNPPSPTLVQARGTVRGLPSRQGGRVGQVHAAAHANAAPAMSLAKAGAEGGQPASGGGTSAKTSASPHDDPAFLAVIARVSAVAEQQGHNNPAQAKAAQAQAAASGPANDVASQAAAAQVGKMSTQEPNPFNKEGFKQALLSKIKEIAPSNLKEADQFKNSGKVAELKGAVSSEVGTSKESAQAPIQQTASEAPSTGGLQPKPVTQLPPTNAGPPPAAVGAADAAPKPKPDGEVSLAESSRSLDQQMASGGITQDQLAKSNEPQFQSALQARQQTQEQAQNAPLAYRKAEQGLLEGAKAEAAGDAGSQLQAMHGDRGHAFAQIAGHQLSTKGIDEQARAQVAQRIQDIYQGTKQKVDARLQQLDQQTDQAFDHGAEQARTEFENYVDKRFSAWKFERYLNQVGGSLLWAKDELFGLPDEVNAFYTEGRDLYISSMDGVIDQVASLVEPGLTEAKALITAGWQEVQNYVHGLPSDLRQIGEEAVGKIQQSFDGLRESVDAKRDQLIDKLADKYVASLKQIDARIDEMKAQNKGLVDKAKEEIAGVIETIKNLKNMLFGVLARAAAAVELIIKDPIGFLGNLVTGIKNGFMNFVGNIAAHMKQGFMDWLFGAVAEAGIQLPKAFDLAGILSIVFQVLGLTWAAIRARAVAILGEKVVAALETTVEVIQKVITEGPGALWEWIKDKVGDLKSMVMDQLQNFIVTRVIVAGITWLIGLLNPASAFIKACKAIYDIVMFFVERGAQIVALVNAVIESVTAIASGALGAAANFVENALARGIPVVIGFLASLLGLGGISEKIKEVIEAIRKPIGEAIDWVIGKAVSLVKAAGKSIAALFGKGKDKDKAEEHKDLGDAKNAARAAIHARLGEDTTLETARSAVEGVRHQLEPIGLKDLEIGPQESDGSLPILAAASAREVVGKLAPNDGEAIVVVHARVTLQDRPKSRGQLLSEQSSAQGRSMVEGIQYATAFYGVTEAGFGDLNWTGRAGRLVQVDDAPGTAARRGGQPSAGAILEPSASSTHVDILTWNTRAPRRDSNVSHAEHQLTEWLWHQKLDWQQRVLTISVTVEGRPICELCNVDLREAKTMMKLSNPSITFDWDGPEPKVKNRYSVR